MRVSKIISIILFSVLLFSCKEKVKTNEKSEKIENLKPNVDFNEITSDFIKWWTYHSYNITLSSNFIGLNEQSDTIQKKQFLSRLITGKYIPLEIESNNKIKIYKLFELDSTTNKSIVTTIKSESMTNLKHFKMEGLQFPEFDFTDLNGNTYTNKNTKGKTLILKTWFINCKACVAEFPELNELVEKYKQRNDIIFVSLALDTKAELENFLQKKDFKYKVVPSKRAFIAEKLNLKIYPTHLIIDKNGTITKVVNKASEMIEFLENEKKLTKKIALPPPSK